MPTGFHHPFRSQFRLLKKFGQNLNTDPQETFLNFTRSSFFSANDSRALPVSPTKDFINEHLTFALRHDLHNYLVSDVLAINDRMSMAHSLEMRMPFLDEEVVNFTHQLPATFKLQKGKKWLLKFLLHRLGGKIYTHRKEGFGLPFGAWLHNKSAFHKISPYLEDEQLPVYQFVTFSKVQQLLQQHRKRQEDQSQNIWALLTLSAWLIHQYPRY